MSVQSVSLYFREGSSDKEYHATIEPAGQRFVVNFAYGRRGSTLNTGTKTNVPVDLEAATRIFNKLVAEKKAKGYTEGEAGTPYQHSAKEDRVSGILPQLLNPIDESEVELLIGDDAWCAQEKFDGKRILIQKIGSVAIGVNRKGLTVGLPLPLVEAAKSVPGDYIIDGECIGDSFHAFDALVIHGQDIRSQQYRDRELALLNLLFSGQQRNIKLVATASDRRAKVAIITLLRVQNKEGIVFKRLDAPYKAGRPSSGGTQLKHKFYATLSAIVGNVNGKRSVELQLQGDKGLVTAGNVTIPPNHSVPRVGQIVEVRYLYAFRESGCLFQPVYLGVRADLMPIDCLTDQLKFKGDEEDQ